jgi:hypothetical protein
MNNWASAQMLKEHWEILESRSAKWKLGHPARCLMDNGRQPSNQFASYSYSIAILPNVTFEA